MNIQEHYRCCLKSLKGVRSETYLKSISSTLIELISTTNMLKSTITGEPFLEGGRISVNKHVQLKMLKSILSNPEY